MTEEWDLDLVGLVRTAVESAVEWSWLENSSGQDRRRGGAAMTSSALKDDKMFELDLGSDSEGSRKTLTWTSKRSPTTSSMCRIFLSISAKCSKFF